MGGGGGGGNSDYAEAQARQERERQRARNALNAAFGVAPSNSVLGGGSYTTQDRVNAVFDPVDGFFGPPSLDIWGRGRTVSGGDTRFDQATYEQNRQEYEQQVADAAKNRTARDALYDKVRTDAFTAGRRGLDENRQRASRDLRFALFGQGLQGGSVDVDENALLGRTYDQGLLDLGTKADAARTGLKSSDEQTRLGLLQSIDAGMDQGSALSSALEQMKVNSERASQDAMGTDLGNLFDNAGLLYTRSNAARGRQAAQQDWWNNYPPRSSSRTSRNSSGIVSSTY